MKNVDTQAASARQKWHIGTVSLLILLAVCTITITQTDLVQQLASSASSTLEAPARLYFVASKPGPLMVGETQDIDLVVHAKIPINSLGARISFPNTIIEVVGISKEKSFLDLWTEDTRINEDAHIVGFSGGTTKKGGVQGDAVALTITIKATRAGTGTLNLHDVLIYPNDGTGISLEHDQIALTIQTEEPRTYGGGSNTGSFAATSADFNNDGKVSLIDISIFAFKMIGPYDSRFDLDQDGKLGLSDLSVLFARRD